MKNKNISWSRTVVGAVSVLFVGVLISCNPEQSENLINEVFQFIVKKLGFSYLWLALAGLGVLIWLAFSRLGEIKLGEGSPDFSKFQIFCMVICAGFGSGTLYWGFIETSYYYYQPPFELPSGSEEAMEWALAYNFFHWGPAAWTMFTICAIPVCYTYYILKKKDLKFSFICNLIFNGKLPKLICVFIDVLFIFISVGSVSISLGLSLPVISAVISSAFGIQNNIYISVALIVIIAIVFILSSMKGLESGMSKISDLNIKLCAIFIALVFLLGPKLFIIDNTTNALGLFIQNYFRMSTWLAPVTGDSFPRVWTVFYLAYWLAFGPFVGIFLAKISKGHRLKDMIIISVGAGSLGSFVMHGVSQNYTLHSLLTGKVDAVNTLLKGKDDYFILEVLKSMPLSTLMIIIFTVTCILFMATTMDSCAYSMALVSCNQVDEEGNPPSRLKLFWCIILPIMPLILVAIDASLDTIKTVAIISTVPVGIIIIAMLYGSVREMVHEVDRNVFNKTDWTDLKIMRDKQCVDR